MPLPPLFTHYPTVTPTSILFPPNQKLPKITHLSIIPLTNLSKTPKNSITSTPPSLPQPSPPTPHKQKIKCRHAPSLRLISTNFVSQSAPIPPILFAKKPLNKNKI